MANRKCAQCGLVNFAAAEVCRRCNTALAMAEAGGEEVLTAEAGDGDGDDDATPEKAPRSIFKRIGVSLAVAAFLLLLFFISLLETSTPVTYDEKLIVARAIDLIERSGFERDAFLLRRLASYRTTDHWWNSWLGHQDAYAATNFPFEIVTLYPEFFRFPVDDTERAVILLHEARHLAGAGEEKAFASVWRDKAKLGWTREKYERTRVWKNVNEFTLKYAPEVFRCGADGQQDCVELSNAGPSAQLAP